MRVVYVDHCAQLSGGEIALLNLLEAMPEVQPLVLLAEDGPFADRLRTQGVSVEMMPMPERTRSLRRHRIPAGVGLATVVDSVFSLEEIDGAARRLTSPERFGKVVLSIA